jgi:tetratricopeptide (TPR) repeat protein
MHLCSPFYMVAPIVHNRVFCMTQSIVPPLYAAMIAAAITACSLAFSPAFAADIHYDKTSLDRALTAAISDEFNGREPKARDTFTAIVKADLPPDLKHLQTRAKIRLTRSQVAAGDTSAIRCDVSGLVGLARRDSSANTEIVVDLDDLANAYLESYHTFSRESVAPLVNCMQIRRFISPNHAHLGEVYRKLKEYEQLHGNLAKAISWQKEATNISSQFPPGKRQMEIIDRSSLINLYLSTQQWTEAETQGTKIIDLCQRLNCYKTHVPAAEYAVGCGQLARHQYREAIVTLQKAREDALKAPVDLKAIAKLCEEKLKIAQAEMSKIAFDGHKH